MDLPASTPLPPAVQSGDFDGPLDLLLEEVRRQNVSIENVSMAPMLSRFLQYLQGASQRNLNLDIEWLHMAATLILWKSQSLLPVEPGQNPERDPIREELVRQLVAHKKKLALDLDRLRDLEQSSFSRHTQAPSAKDTEQPILTTVWDLIQQARAIERWIHQQNRLNHALAPLITSPDEVRVSDMIAYLHERFDATGAQVLDGIYLLEEQISADRRCCLFLAMLQMAHSQQIAIEQAESFGGIALSRLKL
jgi:segregation and condensation protein A